MLALSGAHWGTREGTLAITTPPKQTNGTAQVFQRPLLCHQGALAPDAPTWSLALRFLSEGTDS